MTQFLKKIRAKADAKMDDAVKFSNAINPRRLVLKPLAAAVKMVMMAMKAEYEFEQQRKIFDHKK